MAHDVFICYSSKDKTAADAVCAVLESEGIRCWIAPRDILAGMSYGEAIVDAIHNTKALVLVFSGHANASPQIEREVERAINKRIPVVPLRIEDVAPDKALEYFLSTPHWLDAFTPPLERHLRNLAGQVHRLIGTTKPEAKPDTVAAAGASPFKTVQTPEPASAGPATPTGFMGAAAGAAAAGTTAGAAGGTRTSSGAESVGGFVPSAATGKPATSPIAWFKKLDTGAKVGIGAGALALVIGVGWMLSSGSGPTPSPLVSVPGVNIDPRGGVTVNDGKQTVHVGPDGVRTGNGATPTPQTPQTPTAPGDGTTPLLPSDGNVIPGRETTATTPSAVTGGAYESVTGADMTAFLNEAGYQSTMATDNEGDPLIRGTIEGLKFDIYFYRCNKEASRRCMDLQFHASFSNDKNVGNEQMNAYNRDNRFGQAYFMANGDLGLDMSATIQGGVSRQHIKEIIDWWKVTLTAFPKKFGGG